MNHKRKIIYLASFLFSIPVALTTYINSSFLEGYIGAKNVALVYTGASISTILMLLIMPKILTILGNRLAGILMSVLAIVSLLLLAFGGEVKLAILGFVLYFVCTNLVFMSLDIFIEDFSQHSAIGKFRGIYLVIINSAWVVAQAVSGSIIVKSSFEGIYLLSAGLTLLMTLILIFSLRDFVDPKYKKVPIIKTFIFFWENKNIFKIYCLNFVLKFFFAWMIIYSPIYLHERMGFEWNEIGFIFTIMLLPFVILEFPLGRLSDKIGEKKMLAIGFLIAAFFTLVIPLIKSPVPWVFALVLFFTRVGAATIEIMSESYFFKSIKEENADAISFFRNTGPVSFIIAPLATIPIFFFTDKFEYLFLILGIILVLGFFTTLKLKDIR